MKNWADFHYLGVGFSWLARDALIMHEMGYALRHSVMIPGLQEGASMACLLSHFTY